MTKKVFCEDCNENMLVCYTKQGLKLYVCKHNKTKIVKNRTGRPSYGIIYCGRKIFGLKRAFENMTQGTRLTLNQLIEVTENKIDNANLLKCANLALELNFDAEQLPELFKAAVTLGYSLGLDAQKSIESLVTGIARKSRLMLDNIGIVFLAEQAYNWYKKTYEIDRPLTEEERDKAWTQYAICQVIEKAKKVKKQ